MNVYKLLSIVFIGIFLCSCSGGVEIQKTVISSGYDFTEFTKKGFLFTPEQYLDSYEAIGLLEIEVLPEVKRFKQGDNIGDEWMKLYGGTNIWKMKKINVQEVLEAVYEQAVKMGADAVVRLKFDEVQHNNGDVNFNSVKASGFAIKRITK